MTAVRYRPLIATTRYAIPAHDPVCPGEDNGDVDWIAVERTLNREHPQVSLNRDEQRAAALVLTRSGWGKRRISEFLSLYERLIEEWQADAGLLLPNRLCTADGCDRARSGRGLCTRHLQERRVTEKKKQCDHQDQRRRYSEKGRNR
ncbi:hypothetical protein ACFQ2B_27675 [Streptomyces stramineus]|uniref:Transposase n=1 Tax=Streptomyces stramineus TaxID=173861 RepID=A0ABN0ZNK5_9ACTN